MIAAAERAKAAGRPIFIFPEGTRTAVGERRPYQPGVAALYRQLGMPLVPVAVNSGLYWGRNSLVLWPGTARARFLPPIPPGLDQEAFQERLVGDIETASTELAIEAWNEGLRRPIPPALREKFEELRRARTA